MNKGKKLYEGKAKIIYETKEKGLAIQHFKDDATAFNNQKKASIEGKGVLNNRISEHILQNLNQSGIKTHLIKRLNMREQLIRLVEIIPIEFIVRNVATGSLTKRLGIPDGTILEKPLLEYCYKNDDLDEFQSSFMELSGKLEAEQDRDDEDQLVEDINDTIEREDASIGRFITERIQSGNLKLDSRLELELYTSTLLSLCHPSDIPITNKARHIIISNVKTQTKIFSFIVVLPFLLSLH